MTARKPAGRKVTASRTRKVTSKVTVEETETLAVEDTAEFPAIVRPAPGWDAVRTLTPADIRKQRQVQVVRASVMVVAQAAEGDPADDAHMIQTAANILRAGPGAAAPQLLYGRY